jgi:hypothetical protein
MILENMQSLVEHLIAEAAQTMTDLTYTNVLHLLTESGIDVSAMTDDQMAHLMDMLERQGPVELPPDLDGVRFSGSQGSSCVDRGIYGTMRPRRHPWDPWG